MRDKEKIVNASYIYRRALARHQIAGLDLPALMTHRYLYLEYGMDITLRNMWRILRAMRTIKAEVQDGRSK